MRNDPDHPRSRNPNEDLSSARRADEHSDRNRVTRLRQLHRLVGSAGGTDRSNGSLPRRAEVAFDQLDEAYHCCATTTDRLERSRWLRERTEQLRTRTRTPASSNTPYSSTAMRSTKRECSSDASSARRCVASSGRDRTPPRRRHALREEHRNQNRPAHVDVDPRRGPRSNARRFDCVNGRRVGRRPRSRSSPMQAHPLPTRLYARLNTASLACASTTNGGRSSEASRLTRTCQPPALSAWSSRPKRCAWVGCRRGHGERPAPLRRGPQAAVRSVPGAFPRPGDEPLPERLSRPSPPKARRPLAVDPRGRPGPRAVARPQARRGPVR